MGPVLKPDVMGGVVLGDHIKFVNAPMLIRAAERQLCLAKRDLLDRRDKRFNDKAPARFQMRGGILKARDLCGLSIPAGCQLLQHAQSKLINGSVAEPVNAVVICGHIVAKEAIIGHDRLLTVSAHAIEHIEILDFQDARDDHADQNNPQNE